MRTNGVHAVIVAVVIATAGTGFGQQKQQNKADSPPASQPERMVQRDLTVAILDFSAKDPARPELGAQISETLTAMLSGEPGYKLVDRTSMDQMLREHELNLSGVVSTEQAVRVGQLLGARLLVSGKAFKLGTRTFITAKLIGTETSRVEGVLVKGDEGADIGELVIQLAGDLNKRITTKGNELVAERGPVDPLPDLKRRLAGIKKPKVAVIVTEQHHAERVAPRVLDPAAETEIKKMLIDCGFEIADVPENALADWAKVAKTKDVTTWPQGLKDVDYVITGEAFSEFASRIGNLVVCTARTEINMIHRDKGMIALASRHTCRAVDLAEHTAGKAALQKAGRLVGIDILKHFAPPKKRAGGGKASTLKDNEANLQKSEK